LSWEALAEVINPVLKKTLSITILLYISLFKGLVPLDRFNCKIARSVVASGHFNFNLVPGLIRPGVLLP